MQVDVFNGDADGLCALQQLYLHAPNPHSLLVTGVKRHVTLLQGLMLPASTHLNVLDISFDSNAQAVAQLLAQGVHIFYSDHHQATQLTPHPNLTARIHSSPKVCTSMLINTHLKKAYPLWAAVGAFGDNLIAVAKSVLQAAVKLNTDQTNALAELGQLLNYNGYGERVTDLFFHPASLARMLRPYASPLDFVADSANASVLHTLRRGLANDLAMAQSISPQTWQGPQRARAKAKAGDGKKKAAIKASPKPPHTQTVHAMAWLLPPQAWARRVMGVFANQQAQAHPQAAIALGVPNHPGSWRISVRAPLQHPYGANTLVQAFPGGGGREGAAGITDLPAAQLPAFLQAFDRAFQGSTPP